MKPTDLLTSIKPVDVLRRRTQEEGVRKEMAVVAASLVSVKNTGKFPSPRESLAPAFVQKGFVRQVSSERYQLTEKGSYAAKLFQKMVRKK